MIIRLLLPGVLLLPLLALPPLAEAAPRCEGERATIVGSHKNDNLRGTQRDDVFFGDRGNDRIRGRGGNDVLCGGAGQDDLIPGAGIDTAIGQAGADEVAGAGGSDTLEGGPGDDVIEDDGGVDFLIEAGAGDDVVSVVCPGTEPRVQATNVNGGPGNDQITSRCEGSGLGGDAGDDILIGGGGRSMLNGGPGNDVIEDRYSIRADCPGSRHVSDFAYCVDEGMFPWPYDDWLQGDLGDDLIIGGVGQDQVMGEEGDDLLSGGPGDDGLSGGGGTDTCDGQDGTDHDGTLLGWPANTCETRRSVEWDHPYSAPYSPAELVDFSVSTTQLSLSRDGKLQFRVQTKDDVGAYRVRVDFSSADGMNTTYAFVDPIAPADASGEAVFEGEIELQGGGSSPVTYKVAMLIFDMGGNGAMHDSLRLAELGFPSEIHVSE